MSKELKKVVSKVKLARTEFEKMVKKQEWVEGARHYAERQGKELKKLIETDVSKVKEFLEKERKQLEKIQKQIPGEVKKLQTFVNGQKKELEKLLATVRKGGLKKATSRKKTTRKKTAKAETQATPDSSTSV